MYCFIKFRRKYNPMNVQRIMAMTMMVSSALAIFFLLQFEKKNIHSNFFISIKAAVDEENSKQI